MREYFGVVLRGNLISVNLSDLPNGTYFLYVSGEDDQKFVRKIMIAK